MKDIRYFKEEIVECDMYKRKNEVGKDFHLSFNIDGSDDGYSLDDIVLECKYNKFKISLIKEGMLRSCIMVNNDFNNIKRHRYIEDLNECKDKTYFLIDNEDEVTYRVIIR